MCFKSVIYDYTNLVLGDDIMNSILHIPDVHKQTLMHKHLILIRKLKSVKIISSLKVAQYPGFLRSTNLESKLIDFFV